MGITAASRHFLQTKRAAQNESDPYDLHSSQVLTINPFRRSHSALARHRPHRLSEIIEASVSSKATLARRHSAAGINAVDIVADTGLIGVNLKDVTKSIEATDGIALRPTRPHTPHSDLQSLAPSATSLAPHEIPLRKSSMSVLSQTFPGSHRASFSTDTNRFLVTRGHAVSPVRNTLARGAQSSEALRTSPARTFIRTTPPYHLLDDHDRRHPRVEISVRLQSPLFVGGGTVEGQIELRIDPNSTKKTLSKLLLISRLSVDIIGVEEVEDGRRQIFLSLASELFDSQHPPPTTLVTSQTPEKGSELYWQTRSGTATISFCVNLPLKLGPPSYSSRQASIRYLLCPSAVVKIGDKRCVLHQAWAIQMLTTHHPERALASLPSPLLACDTLRLRHTPVTQAVKLTAGLHRQTWISGGALFIDIHVVNGSDKGLKRIDLQLEKSVLWYTHPVAGTAEKRAANLRLPTKIETETILKRNIRKNKEWEGVAPQSSEVRTCELDVPKGHVTIGDGRYFEVRYFIKITVSVPRNKAVSVQLPITIIPFNSLDIMPNSLAQVATSIEAKRSMALSKLSNSISRIPGSQQRTVTEGCEEQAPNDMQIPSDSDYDTINALTRDLDQSPRRLAQHANAHATYFSKVQLNQKSENLPPAPSSCYRHLRLRPSCYHCHLLLADHAAKVDRISGPRLPRLQVSTSGLGFSESEFELPSEPPRKVMMSEKERQMINQQREINLQRQWSQQKKARQRTGMRAEHTNLAVTGWKNVAVFPNIASGLAHSASQYRSQVLKPSNLDDNAIARRHRISYPQAAPRRSRSRRRTNPDLIRASFSDAEPSGAGKHQASRGIRTMDRVDQSSLSGYNLAENDVFGPRGDGKAAGVV